MFFDVWYLVLVLPAVAFSIWASVRVNGVFRKYERYGNARNLTGAEAARMILQRNGLMHVRVEAVAGNLTDHYDPGTKVVRLSESTYHSTSVSAVGVAAHETGHALQHALGYSPLWLRSALVPAANIGSSAGPVLAMVGLIFQSSFMLNLGILFFGGAVLFYLITLPVEFDASRRAVVQLDQNGMLTASELSPVKKVLRAAAMTYVASAAVAVANLLRLVLLSRSMNDDN